jgi:hypothetical protein
LRSLPGIHSGFSCNAQRHRIVGVDATWFRYCIVTSCRQSALNSPAQGALPDHPCAIRRRCASCERSTFHVELQRSGLYCLALPPNTRDPSTVVTSASGSVGGLRRVAAPLTPSNIYTKTDTQAVAVAVVTRPCALPSCGDLGDLALRPLHSAHGTPTRQNPRCRRHSQTVQWKRVKRDGTCTWTLVRPRRARKTQNAPSSTVNGPIQVPDPDRLSLRTPPFRVEAATAHDTSSVV